MATRPCQACGCPIEMITGPNGKAIPVQRVRTIYTKPRASQETAVLQPDTERLDKLHMPAVTVIADLYVSHFETCSDPGRFSRAKR